MGKQPSTLALLLHLQKYAGSHVQSESKPPSRVSGAYRLESFEEAADGVITVASNGIRHVEQGVPFGEELVCALRKCQRRYARAIVGSTCEYILQSGRGIEFGQIIDTQGELFKGSRKEGLLASAHPYLAEEFNYLAADSELTDDNVDLQIITLLPMSRAEIDFAKRDMDGLYDLWEAINPDFHDIARPSTV